ncbi:hypothetical protein CE91St38_29070 [Desulfovibrionaceae bacterium]|nr:hypothetical protein CE91St38_29070 [Desulfovibrionaceae bacterium]GKI13435.1 hypothetical protein CE91St39_28890 [Desulfovibrionaceae bacterium]
MTRWAVVALAALICVSLAVNAALWTAYRGATEKQAELQIQLAAHEINQEAVNAAIKVQSEAQKLAHQRAAERKDKAARVAADNPDWAGGLLPDDVLRLLPGGEDR